METTITQNQRIDDGVILGYRDGKKVRNAGTHNGNDARIRSNTVIYFGARFGHGLDTGHNVVIRENVVLGNNVSLGNNTVLLEDVSVGDNVYIGHNVVVHPGTKIGRDTVIQDGSILGRTPITGKRSIRKVSMDLPPLEIGERCQICSNVILFGGSKIGDDVLVGDMASVREQTTIGNNTLGAIPRDKEGIIGKPDNCVRF